jgi:hypothetical protein
MPPVVKGVGVSLTIDRLVSVVTEDIFVNGRSLQKGGSAFERLDNVGDILRRGAALPEHLFNQRSHVRFCGLELGGRMRE